MAPGSRRTAINTRPMSQPGGDNIDRSASASSHADDDARVLVISRRLAASPAGSGGRPSRGRSCKTADGAARPREVSSSIPTGVPFPHLTERGSAARGIPIEASV
ncbi:hypothetical protein SETIT_9G236000v2 [Setaria italica]|uniref:Uncharacterized protein n=1 Tax=Setaria italica TaxID=4555 RepID=A0A368SJW9_SETIT|nr:hypothetical protein SETIT_9G236000v2 [Setaria italica]